MTDTMTTDLASAQSGMVGDDAKAIISQVLSDYGLTSLTDWAWDLVTSGASSTQVMLQMPQTTEYQQRFPGMALLAKNGLPAISPSTYINYEQSFKNLVNQYGLPEGIYNSAEIGQAIGGGTSIVEMEARMKDGFAQVANSAPQVRASFAQQFGPAGDAALAAYVMDPDLATPVLENQVAAAQLKGQAGIGGVDINNNLAMKLAQLGVTAAQDQNAVGNVAQQASLYDQQVGRANAPTQGQGIEAQLGTDARSAEEVAAAQSAAASAFKGGGGAEQSTYGSGIGASKPF